MNSTTVKVRLILPIYIAGVLQEPGKILDASASLAGELISRGRAEDASKAVTDRGAAQIARYFSNKEKLAAINAD